MIRTKNKQPANNFKTVTLQQFLRLQAKYIHIYKSYNDYEFLGNYDYEPKSIDYYNKRK